MEERAIQWRIDRSDEKGKKKDQGAMQAGARIYPVPPLPNQHLKKPGNESDLELSPMYDAPHYKGSEKLIDKVALTTQALAVLSPCCSRAKARTLQWPISKNMTMQKRLSAPLKRKGVAAFCFPEM